MDQKKKIRIVSFTLCFFAIIAAIGIFYAGIYTWKIHSHSFSALPSTALTFVPAEQKGNIPTLNSMNVSIRWIGFAAHFTSSLATTLVFVCLAVLFGYYQKMKIFSRGAIGAISAIGYVFLAGGVLEICYCVLTYALLPESFPLSYTQRLGILVYAPIGYTLRYIITGVFVILIGWVMGIGSELEEQQRYTV